MKRIGSIHLAIQDNGFAQQGVAAEHGFRVLPYCPAAVKNSRNGIQGVSTWFLAAQFLTFRLGSCFSCPPRHLLARLSLRHPCQLNLMLGRNMNNTKWREIFKIIADNKVHFRISCHRDSDWNYAHSWTISNNIIGEDLLLDPGLGGPIRYIDIKSIVISKKLTERENLRFQNDVQNIAF